MHRVLKAAPPSPPHHVHAKQETHTHTHAACRWSVDKQGNEFMVLELVKLGALDKLLLAFGPTIRTAAKIVMCEQICSAMCELATEGVLHRCGCARACV